MKNIDVFGYATFGTPNGFTQSCISGNQMLEKVLKTFDLKTNAIQLISNNDRIYSIRQESFQDNLIISYSVYTYAKEKNSNRAGTFIGTSLVFTNELIPENTTLNSLHEIHKNLKNNNVNNQILNINHSKDFNLKNVFSKDFEKLNHQATKINIKNWENSEKNLVIYTSKFDQNEIQNLFKKSLQMLPKYGTIYFIDSKEIAQFVSQKKLFRLIDKNSLDNEIEKLKAERKQKFESEILKFTNKKLEIEVQRKNINVELEKQIEQNLQKHSENEKKIEELKSNLIVLDLIFQNFSSQFSSLISDLQEGKQIDEVNNTYIQLEKVFNEEKRKLSFTTLISSIPNQRNNNRSNPSYEFETSYNQADEQGNRIKYNVPVFISIIVNILLIGGASYLYYLYDQKEKKIFEYEQAEVKNNQNESTNEETLVIENNLNPKPNDIAKKKVVDIKSKLIENSTSIEDVVKIIFELNQPIKEVYQLQKKDYEEFLLKENPSAFDSNKTLIKKDSLVRIPVFKKL